MDQRQRTNRFGLFLILCACAMRLFTGGTFLTYLETGRNVRFSASDGEFLLHLRESPSPWLPEAEPLRFTAEDAAGVEMDYDCILRPDLAKLMEEPLDWDLTGEDPTVLILHTHTTESYTKTGETYEETSDYRTRSPEYNMISIGDAVSQILEKAGISVLHDREVHDYPSYNGSYVHARESTERILQEHPSIRLILDLHRDALEQNGRQLRTVADVDGEPCARLMLVVGTNVSRQSHENWQKNLALGLKLHVVLERSCPGIMRPLNLRTQRFNQDLSPGALIVEVGAAGNTHTEALKAARTLAEAIISLARGAG